MRKNCFFKIIGFLSVFLAINSCQNSVEKSLDLKLEGINLLYQSKYDDAIDFFNKSLKYNDKDPETYYFLGASYYGKKDEQKAEDYYTKAINTDSTFGRAYINRGRIYKNRLQHDKACQDWLKAEECGVKTLGEETKFCKPD